MDKKTVVQKMPNKKLSGSSFRPEKMGTIMNTSKNWSSQTGGQFKRKKLIGAKLIMPQQANINPRLVEPAGWGEGLDELCLQDCTPPPPPPPHVYAIGKGKQTRGPSRRGGMDEDRKITARDTKGREERETGY
jgi:hypothetical protein